MCGRFSLSSPADVLKEQFGLSACPELKPRYNIAPSQDAAVIRQGESGERSLGLLHWGLIPSWARDASIGNRMINARAETVAEKPSFRSALQKRRCIIPADGFYEWKPAEQGRQPYFIQPRGGSLLGLAGLWAKWTGGDGQAIESFTIMTTGANAFMRSLHDRMPVILARDCYEPWLNCKDYDGRQVNHLLKPWPSTDLQAHTVGKQVNSPKNDSRACIQEWSDSGS